MRTIPALVVMTPATVEDAYSMLIEAVSIDDPVIYCEHKYLYYHLKADALPKEVMPIGKARIVRPGRDLTHRHLQRHGARGLDRGRGIAAATASRSKSSTCARSSRSIPTPSLRPSRAPAGCSAWANPFPGAASPPRSSRAWPPKAFTCSMPRPRRAEREGHAHPLSPQPLVGTHRPNAKVIAEKARKILRRTTFMPQVPITMPQLGESMAEATIVTIKVKPGDKVAADQEIIEVETDKAVMGVTTPCAGEVAKIEAEVKKVYSVGAVLGYIEASEADAARLVKKKPAPPKGEVAKEVPGREEETDGNGSGSHFQVDKTELRRVPTGSFEGEGGLPVPASARGAGYLSPRMRARMAELRLTQADLAGIAGSGQAGRVTVKDLETFLGNLDQQTAEDVSAIRTGVADAMRRSWTRPLATVGLAVSLDPVLEDRKKRDPKPGPALYALRALALALAENPAAAARLIGNRAVRSESIDIGVAVEAQDGIMVPVIRQADKTSLADLTAKYTELVELARRRRVTSDMTSGGIASVSNFGTFGLDWGTPIPLPDQTLLLGMGAGKKAPVWNGEKKNFEPVTQAELTLSFDHRSLDGGGAGRLLQKVAELLQDPAKL